MGKLSENQCRDGKNAAQVEIEGKKKAATTKVISDLNTSELFTINMPRKVRDCSGHVRKIMAMAWKPGSSSELIAADHGGKVICWNMRQGGTGGIKSQARAPLPRHVARHAHSGRWVGRVPRSLRPMARV
jgi:hypothetical protein